MMNNKKDVFISCEASYQQADIVLFGADFDGTVSFRPGTRFGPSAIRKASYGLETYSWHLRKDLEDIRVFDFGDLEAGFGNVDVTHQKIYEFVLTVLKDQKIPFMIGGEHSISYPSIKAVSEVYSDLVVLQLDAHADLRQEYYGVSQSHASVMRRCYPLLKPKHLIQWGIRSGTKDEHEFALLHTNLLEADVKQLSEILEQFKDKPLYVTLDVDVFDPSIISGTGTPEPGGIDFKTFLEVCNVLKNSKIVALDVVECAPDYDHSGVSAVACAKVVRECLLTLGGSNE